MDGKGSLRARGESGRSTVDLAIKRPGPGSGRTRGTLDGLVAATEITRVSSSKPSILREQLVEGLLPLIVCAADPRRPRYGQPA